MHCANANLFPFCKIFIFILQSTVLNKYSIMSSFQCKKKKKCQRFSEKVLHVGPTKFWVMTRTIQV